MSSNKNNPYAQAAGTYDMNARQHTPDQRELEGRILLKAARMFQDIQANWDTLERDTLSEALKYNRQLWLLFYNAALENPEGDRPTDLRSNIINLANFIFKREMEILSNPQKDKLNILININKEVAAGLMMQQRNAATSSAQTPPSSTPPQSGQSTNIEG